MRSDERRAPASEPRRPPPTAAKTQAAATAPSRAATATHADAGRPVATTARRPVAVASQERPETPPPTHAAALSRPPTRAPALAASEQATHPSTPKETPPPISVGLLPTSSDKPEANNIEAVCDKVRRITHYLFERYARSAALKNDTSPSDFTRLPYNGFSGGACAYNSVNPTTHFARCLA